MDRATYGHKRERDPRCGEREDRNLRNTHTPGEREKEGLRKEETGRDEKRERGREREGVLRER